jgi:hypothetical protein
MNQHISTQLVSARAEERVAEAERERLAAQLRGTRTTSEPRPWTALLGRLVAARREATAR